MTPLMRACATCNAPMIRLLLNHGATTDHIEAMDSEGAMYQVGGKDLLVDSLEGGHERYGECVQLLTERTRPAVVSPAAEGHELERLDAAIAALLRVHSSRTSVVVFTSQPTPP